MKNTALILGLICITMMPTNSVAQDMAQYPISDSIRAEARQMANELMKELGLKTKQALLVEDKLASFLSYKKQIINSDLPAAVKTKKLEELNNHKFSEMQDILTQVQYDIYVRKK